MKFRFDRDAMIKEISIAQEIISTKNVVSILSNVYFSANSNALTIRATDIKINFETQIPVEIDEEGSTTVFCDKFLNILNSLPSGEIEFVQNDNGIVITPVSKKVNFKLKSIASDKFPEFSTTGDYNFFEISSADFKEMVNQTIFAVSDDQARYFMNGVYFVKDGNNLVMVATDGRRLSIIKKEIAQNIEDFEGVIIPPKILNIIIRRASSEGNIKIAVADKNIFFNFSNYNFSSVLIDGQFPNYQRVIPEKQTNVFEIQKSDMVEALKRVSLLTEQKTRKINFEIEPGKLTVVSQESDIGTAKEEIPCKYDGEPVSISFNYLYIEEPLKVMNSERICFEFTEKMKAATLRTEPKSDSIHIIMPMME